MALKTLLLWEISCHTWSLTLRIRRFLACMWEKGVASPEHPLCILGRLQQMISFSEEIIETLVFSVDRVVSTF